MKTLTSLLVLSAGLVLAPHAAAAKRMTRFIPEKHGFKFNNEFKNDFIPALDWRTGGLCGGMSYAALDYYFAGRPVPTQDYRPANLTPLRHYLYARTVEQIKDHADKWAELGFNPFGARDSEFFHWGLQGFGGGRLQELRECIDKGIPVPLGLQKAGANHHVVVAVGYDMGRYKGDLKAHKGDLKILVYDPSFPGKTKELIPDLKAQVYTYKENPEKTWRAYFVARRYKRKTAPVIPSPNYPKDGKAHELIVSCTTGNDDLRGGSDNVNLTVNLTDGTRQHYPNINLGARWILGSTECARVVLKKAVPPLKIRSLTLSTTFKGGIAGDNWDMKKVSVRTIGGGGSVPLVKEAGPYRFTGQKKQLTVPCKP